MGKVYSFEKIKLERRLNNLQDALAEKLRYCEKNGYIWSDHYIIREIHEQIKGVKRQLRDDYEESP